jgi:subtilase family serine protease
VVGCKQFGRVVARLAGAAIGAQVLSFAASMPALAVEAHAMVPAVVADGDFQPLGDMQGLGLAPAPCQRTVPAQCFGPDQLRVAYNIQPVLDAGITGAGRTIVIVDGFQSPTIQKDLATFDAIWHLPAPPAFNIVAPDGLTPFVLNPVQVPWALEISIDVEMAHAIAPGAAITLVLAKSGSDVDLLSATKYAVKHNLGDVITQSYGEAEQCAAPGILSKQHEVYGMANAKGIGVFAASGDNGATERTCDGSSVLGVRAVSTPASDPNVTAVGGTTLVADGISGAYQSESAWPRSGGGFSSKFRRPSYQSSIHQNRFRGLPDVAYDAGTRVLVVWSLLAPPGNPGIGMVGGTSVGTPQWAAIQALGDHAAGHRLGLLNKALYRGGHGDDNEHAGAGAFHDITSGTNSIGPVTGFAAAPGWDAVTGLGTPNVANLMRSLRKSED